MWGWRVDAKAWVTEASRAALRGGAPSRTPIACLRKKEGAGPARPLPASYVWAALHTLGMEATCELGQGLFGWLLA